MPGKQLDVDKIQLEVTVDGSPARKDLAETKQAVRQLKDEQERLKQKIKEVTAERKAAKTNEDVEGIKRTTNELAKLQKEYGAVTTKIAESTTKTKALQEQLGAAGLSANELRGYLGRLKSELNAGVLSGTPEEAEKIKLIQDLEAQYKALSTTMGRTRVLWESERKAIDLNSMSIRQLGLELDRWEDIKDRSDPNSAEWAEADAAIKRVKDRTAELTDTQKRAEAQWDKDRHTISLTAASVEQLGLEEKRLQAILANPNTNAADRRKAAEDLRVVQDRTEQLTDANRIARDVWEQQRKEMKLVEMNVHQLGLEEQRLKAIINAPTTSDADRQQAARHLEAVIQRTKELTDLNHIAAKAWEDERKSIDLVDMSLEQLGKETARYKEIQRTAQPNSAQYTEATVGLAAVKDRTEQLTNASRMAADEWVKMRGKLTLDQMSIQQLKLEKQYLDDLRGSLQRTDPALAKIEQDFIAVEKALKGATEQTALQERQWERMRGSLKLTDMSIEELEQEVKFLNAAIARMKPGDTGLDKLRRDAQAAEGQLAKLKTGLGPFGQMWASIKTQMLGAGAVIGTLFAGGAIMQGIRSLISSSAKVSDEFAEIQKVTGKTADEVKRLNTEISHIDTRTASTDLRGIAVGLGQAGQEVTGVAIAAIDKINLALGSEFGASAKEITNTVSVLRNNLSDVKSGNYAEDVGKIGNAILVLGQSGLATAPVVSDIGNRIAGVARQFDVSSGQILGTAAAFQELGISTERGSTAYTKLLQKISVNPQAFADVVKKAGGNVEEFNRLVNTDMQAAFLMVAKSAKDAGSENTEFGAILKELETSGAGVSELLSKVGANTELFAEKARIATEALKNQNAINAQAELANQTLAAQLEKLGKIFKQVFTSTTVINGIKAIVAGLTDLVKWVKENSSALTFWAGVLVKGVAVWATYRAGAVLATLASKAWSTATDLAGNVTAVFAGKVNLATRASQLFAAAWKTNPLGLIISAVTTAYSLFSTFRDVVASASDGLRELAQADQEAYQKANTLYYQIMLANKGTTERHDLIEKLKALYPSYLSSLDADKASNEDLTKAMEGLNEQLVRKIELQKLDAKSQEQAEKIADIAIERADVEVGLKKSLVETAKAYGLTLKANGTLEEKALDLRRQLIAQQEDETDSAYQSALGEINGALETMHGLTRDLTKANKEGLEMDGQRGEMVQALSDDFLTAADSAKKLYTAQQQAALAVPSRTSAPYVNPTAVLFGTAPRPQAVQPVPNATTPRAQTTPETPLDGELQKRLEEGTATAGEYAAAIKRLKEELKGVSNPAEGKRLQALIQHFTELKSAIDGTGTGAKRSKDELKKHIDDVTTELNKWRAEMQRDTLSADQKELAELDAKHAEELKKVKEQHAELLKAGKITPEQVATDLTALAADQDRERKALQKKQSDERMKSLKDTNAKIQAALGEGHNATLQAEADVLQKQMDAATEGSAEREELQRRHNEALLRLYQANAEAALSKEGEAWDGLILEAKKQIAKLDELISTPGNTDQEEQDLLEQRRKLSASVVALENAKNQGIRNSNNKRRAEEKAAEAKATLEQRQEFAKRIQAWAGVAQAVGSITGALQQNAEQAADADGKRTKAESARIRRIALLNIAIQTATAIANGVAQAMAAGPFPANLAAAATTIATVIGLMGQASSLLGSSGGSDGPTNNPNWSDNNLTLTGEKGIRELPGPSHAGGGLDVIDTSTGKRVANIEGGEAVVNKDVTAKNPEVIDELMAAAHRADKQVRMEEVHPTRGTALVNAAAPGTAGGGTPKPMATGGLLGMEGTPSAAEQHPTRGTALVNVAGPNTQDRKQLTDLPQLKLEDGGIFKGSLHRDGGNTVIDNRTGQAIAEVEKDEPWMVLSRAFREKNSALIPTLLEASRRGLRLDHISTAPIPVPNPQRVAQAMRLAHYAQGGLFGMEVPSKKQKNPGANDDGLEHQLLNAVNELVGINRKMFDQNDQLIRRMGDVNEGVRKFPTSIKAYTVLNKEHDRTLAQWEAMKERYSARA